MSGRTKPHRPRGGQRRPAMYATNAVQLAISLARKYSDAEVNFFMQPVHEAFRAMREGVGTHWNWKQLASAVQIGLSIEHKGIVRGLKGHLDLADKVLATIAQRATQGGTAWRATPLWFTELDALDTFATIHEFQLRKLSAGEFEAAFQHAVSEIQRVGGELAQDARIAIATAPAVAQLIHEVAHG